MKVVNRFGERRRPVVETGPGLTEQSHKAQCDINLILKDYVKTGLVRHAAQFEGRYDDVSALEFQDAMRLVRNAQEMFEQLPAATRKRFGNDPAAFLEFTQNPANGPEMARLGMLKGNDGIDVRGAAVAAPTASSVKAERLPEAVPQEQPQGKAQP